MIQYRCECGRMLQADEDQAGQRARCPSCGAVNRIPSEAVRDARPARRDDRDDDRPRRGDDRDDDDRPRRRRRRDEEPAKSNVTTILLIVGGALAGILLVCGGLVYAGYTAFSSAFAQVAEARDRVQESNNFKQMAIAMHAFHDTRGQLPRPAIESPDGKPLLSWRVALLPYVENDNLYRQFKLDEPWDSNHNKQLIPMIPRVYLRPGQVPDGSGKTHYQAVVGKGLLFDYKHATPQGKLSGRRLMDITDGTSNTIMFVVAKDPVIWTKPEDIDADDGAAILPRLDKRFKAGTVMATADGFVRPIRPGVSEATLKAALTAAGGEIVGPDW
jgi:phage FluMu protein Com